MKGLILAGLLLIAGTANAGDVLVGGGKAYLRGSTHAEAITYQDELGEVKYFGDIKYEVSFLNLGPSNIWGRGQPDKQTIIGRFIKGFRNDQIEVGIGLAYSDVNDDYNGSHANFSEVFRFNLKSGYYVEVIHISNAGLVRPNLGRDVLTAGKRF